MLPRTMLRLPGRARTARWLGLVLALAAATRVAHAQLRIAPYAAGALGVSDVRTSLPVQTNPPTVSVYHDHNGSLLSAVNLGVEFGSHVAVEAAFRSSVGIGVPFRVLTLGPSVRWGQRVQVSLRGGLGRVQGFQGVSCVASAPGCPRYTNEWRSGFDLAAGVDFPSGGRWSIGPVVWWAQSTSSATRYRSLGLGARVGYR